MVRNYAYIKRIVVRQNNYSCRYSFDRLETTRHGMKSNGAWKNIQGLGKGIICIIL